MPVEPTRMETACRPDACLMPPLDVPGPRGDGPFSLPFLIGSLVRLRHTGRPDGAEDLPAFPDGLPQAEESLRGMLLRS